MDAIWGTRVSVEEAVFCVHNGLPLNVRHPPLIFTRWKLLLLQLQSVLYASKS